MDGLNLFAALGGVLLLASAVVVVLRHRRWLRKRHVIGLRWCGLLLELVLRMQQHRGMASAMLAGDGSFRTPLRHKREEIERLFLAVQALPADIDRSVTDIASRELPELRKNWTGLCAQLDSLTPFTSMTRHTALIGTLLFALRNIGEICLSGRIARHDARLEMVVPVFVDRLPALSEALGQIRALGSGVAAAGSASAEDRVRLSYLIHRINELVGRSESALAHAGLLKMAESASGFEHSRARVGQLLDMVCRDLLEAREVQVSPQTYFACASTAIDSVFALVAVLRQQLAFGMEEMPARTLVSAPARARQQIAAAGINPPGAPSLG